MATLQENVQANARALTGTEQTYYGDLHALADLYGVDAGQIDGRLITCAQYHDSSIGTASGAHNLFLLNPEKVFSPKILSIAGYTHLWIRPTVFSTLYQDSAGTTPVTAVEQGVGKATDQSGGGNDLAQATGASRPILMSRVNRIIYSEDLSNGAWAKTNATIATNSANDSAGAATLDKIIASAVLGEHNVNQGSISDGGGTSYAYFEARAGEYGWVCCRYDGRNAFLNLTTGAVGTLDANVSVPMVENLSGGLFRFKVAFGSVTAGTKTLVFRACTADNTVNYTGDGASGIYVGKIMLSYDSAIAYQAITTATSYDTAGFPLYLNHDGSDDSMASATGGGSTTGFLYVAAVMLKAGELTQTLFSDRDANTGYRVAIDTSNRLELTAGDGVGYTTVVSAALTVGTTYILSAWHDGTNLNVQVNNNTAVQQAFATATAGSAGFTLGQSNTAAADYLNARVYGDSPTYVKDWTYNAAQLQAIKQFHAAYAGVSL